MSRQTLVCSPKLDEALGLTTLAGELTAGPARTVGRHHRSFANPSMVVSAG